jgi:hypothetical protein
MNCIVKSAFVGGLFNYDSIGFNICCTKEHDVRNMKIGLKNVCAEK